MSAIIARRSVRRTVEVEVDVTVDDLTSELNNLDLAALCSERGLVCFAPLADSSCSGRRGLQGVLLSDNDLEEMADLLRDRDLEGALLLLDRLVPHRFRNFARAFGPQLGSARQ